MNTLKRKFNKFKKSPKQFFKDMKAYKKLYNSFNTTNNEFLYKIISVSESGFIHLPDLGKYSQHRVVILFNEKYKNIIGDLNNEIYKYIKKERILFYSYKLDYIEKLGANFQLNNATRLRLAEYSHIFVFSDNDYFSAVLQHIYHNINVIHINITQTLTTNGGFSANSIIFFKKQENENSFFYRNCYFANNAVELCMYIKYIYDVYRERQEDYLIPVISDLSLKTDTLTNCSSDILLLLKENSKFKSGCFTHREYLQYLADNTEELFVRESVFIKYNFTINKRDLLNFYSLATYDNLKIDIRKGTINDAQQAY